MIEFINVSKTYEDNDTNAINGIDLKIDDGEFVFIVGSSGAGKSTLLKLIMREQIPTTGDIVIDGQIINKLKRREVPYFRRKMGMVYQDFRLIDKMNVFDNVAFAMRVIGKSSSDINDRVKHILKHVGLEHKLKERPSQLSGGEQQRVSLARALVNNPKIIIADEPTANVDAEMSKEIISLLKKISDDGTTVVVVTHDKELVKQFADRIIEIEKGKIVSDTGSKKTEAPKKNNKINIDSTTGSNLQIDDNIQEDIETVSTTEDSSEIYKLEIQTEDIICENNCYEYDLPENNNVDCDEINFSKYDTLIQEIRLEQVEKSAK